MNFRKIVLALFEKISRRIRRHPAFFAILGSTIVFSTVVIKDNISEDIRSHLQAVEAAKQFYSLHSEDIELAAQLGRIDDKIETLRQMIAMGNVSGDLQKLANTTTANYNEGYKNAKLTEASNSDTEELLKHVDDSELMFLWSEGQERMIKFNIKSAKGLLEELFAQLEESKTDLTNASTMVNVPNHNFTREEGMNIHALFSTAENKSEKAAIQAIHLRADALGNRNMALEVAESYRNLLESEDRICKWVIIVLIVLGSGLGLLSQLVGIESGQPDAARV